MAHFVELDAQNVVLRGVVIGDKDCLDQDGVENESVGIAFCQSLFGADTVWKQTSYNTYGGVHAGGGTPFRKNYAGNGYVYDETRDAFIAPSPFASWVFNESTCLWEAPIPKPDDTDTEIFVWDEDQVLWQAVPIPPAD